MTFASDLITSATPLFRGGIVVNGGSWDSNLNSNYLGTFTFNSLAAYAAGVPSNFTRRIGDPAIAYSMVDAGLYVQDDFRVRRNLTISPGLRYETQAHMSDWKDLGPRIGLTWAPFKSGRTALRGSAGIFYDWLGQNTYEQALRVDGTHEQELNIINPSFPNPGNSGVVPTSNRYFLDPSLRSPRNVILRRSRPDLLLADVERSANAVCLHADGIPWRGLNENAPGRVRPRLRQCGRRRLGRARGSISSLGWNTACRRKARATSPEVVRGNASRVRNYDAGPEQH